jgi:hypothetical protein
MADRRSSDTKPTTQPQGAHTPGGCSSSDSDRPEWAEHSVVDRRSGIDRRDMQAMRDSLGHGGAAPSSNTGLERRRGPGRRRSDFSKSAEEGEMTREQFLFIQAIEAFKRVNERTYPTWSDVLEVVRLLGYRKTMPSNLSLPQCEDWREPADSPAGCEWLPSKKSRDAA